MIERATIPPLIIFQHIPKTAGSTLHGILNSRFPASAVYNVFGANHGEPEIRELAELPEARKQQIRILKGHMPFGTHRYFNRAYTYITVLREPISRVISQYYYIRRNRRNQHYRLVNESDMSLAEFIQCGVAPGLNNGQVRWLTGDVHGLPFGIDDAALLEEAKANICRDYSLVGLTERFDETTLLLKRLLGWRRYPYYRPQNVARSAHKERPISQHDIDVVRQFNALDIDLYEFAAGIFSKRVSEANIAADILTFRRWNAIYWTARSQMEATGSAIKQLLMRRHERGVSRW